MSEKRKLPFASDYMATGHKQILNRIAQSLNETIIGYGFDQYCKTAKDKIRIACQCPNATIHFLIGGTQTNATVIDALLRPWQGVISASTGHINGHEAGAIEATRHKVITLPHSNGKISAENIRNYIDNFHADSSNNHLVQPGMVYLSQPTEYGTLYSLSELKEISTLCEENNLLLFVDGARLAYALACKDNDVTLPQLTQLCDVFYIGGTKCGAMFGEAVVARDANVLPNFFTLMKQHGAVLAKGWLLGLQFDELFSEKENGKYLYELCGAQGIRLSQKLRNGLAKKGIEQFIPSTTNQTFAIINNDTIRELEKQVELTLWEPYNEKQSIVRFVTSWASTEANIDNLLELIK